MSPSSQVSSTYLKKCIDVLLYCWTFLHSRLLYSSWLLSSWQFQKVDIFTYRCFVQIYWRNVTFSVLSSICTETTDMVQKQNGVRYWRHLVSLGTPLPYARNVEFLDLYHMLVIVLASFSITFLPGSGDLQWESQLFWLAQCQSEITLSLPRRVICISIWHEEMTIL